MRGQRKNRLVNLAIPLGQAVMCLDCEIIINSRNRVCPRCGGDHFAVIGNWVKPLCTARRIVANYAAAIRGEAGAA